MHGAILKLRNVGVGLLKVSLLIQMKLLVALALGGDFNIPSASSCFCPIHHLFALSFRFAACVFVFICMQGEIPASNA